MELVVAALSSLIIQSLLMQLLCMWGLVSHTVPHIEKKIVRGGKVSQFSRID